MKKLSVKAIVATGIGAALFFVLGRFVAIPSMFPNFYISVQYGLLAFMSTVYGPVAGLLIGLIGHALIDFTYGSIWWSWVFGSAAFGLLMGVAAQFLKIEESGIGKMGLVKFNIAQAVCHLISWGLVACLLDILMYAVPTGEAVFQGLNAVLPNTITTAVVGSLLCLAYAARPKAGSLAKE